MGDGVPERALHCSLLLQADVHPPLGAALTWSLLVRLKDGAVASVCRWWYVTNPDFTYGRRGDSWGMGKRGGGGERSRYRKVIRGAIGRRARE